MQTAANIILWAFLFLAGAGQCFAATLASGRPGNFFKPDEALSFTLTLPADLGLDTVTQSIVVDLLTYDRRVVDSRTPAAQLLPGESALITFPPQHEGYYRVEARLAGQAAPEPPLASSSLGVLSAAAPLLSRAALRYGTIAHLKHMDAGDRELMLTLIAQAGFGWIREGFLWHEMEPFPGHWDMYSYDDLVERAFNHGISVLPVLGFGNAWAAASKDELPFLQLRQSLPRLNLWENYVRALLRRYGDRLRVWEVWNEPNLHSFWQPQPSAGDYARLLARSYATIKQELPLATVLSAGLSPNQADHPGRPDTAESVFLRALNQLEPRPFDAVATHPYTLFRQGVTRARTARLFKANLDNLLAGLDGGTEDMSTDREAGRDTVPLWITEIGVSTVASTATEEAAAAHLANILTLAAAHPDIARVFLYNFRDTGTDPQEKEQHFGLLHADYTPKPGFFAVRHFIHTLGDAAFVRDSETPEGVVVHEFRASTGHPVLVVWAPGSQALETGIALPAGFAAARVSNVVGDARELRPSGGSLRLKVGMEPMYLELLPAS